MSKYTNILYWKWDYGTFTGNTMEEKLYDIIKRSDFETLYISFHHVKYPFSDKRVLGLIKKCADILDNAGRKLLLDIDVRNEGVEFSEKYPDNMGYFTRFVEFTLDEEGNGFVDIPNLRVGKVGRGNDAPPPKYILNAWAFSLIGGKPVYKPDSLVNLKAAAELIPVDDSVTRYSVSAGKENAGKSCLIYPAINHAIPDPFSPNLYTFFSGMFELVKDYKISGAATDEWGFELALRNEGDLYYTEHFPYSPHMTVDYEERTGRKMEDDLIHFLYAPEANVGLTTQAVSAYLEVLRAKMKENNDWFYEKSKETFGKDTFIGVHPTFWGDQTDFYVDVVLNGLDWWEVKRDYAQTDEWVLMPIRLALAHKWGGNVWYSMWYSGNTNIKETYFEETWRNARFGGRTHYLGYECIEEPGVYGMSGQGILEEMNEMEGEIMKINDFQASQPDSRLLIVFGIESVSCWNLCDPDSRRWVRNGGTLHGLLEYVKDIFEYGYLCDMIPTSEISNGSLKLVDNRPVYGTQSYDAIVLVSPNGMDKCVLEFFNNYKSENLIIAGECEIFSNGENAENEFSSFTKGIKHHIKNTRNSRDVTDILDRLNIAKNTYEKGCAYQDGSVIFTALGDNHHPDENTPIGIKGTGNPLIVDTIIKGHSVKFEGKDFLAINLNDDGSIKSLAYGECSSIEID